MFALSCGLFKEITAVDILAVAHVLLGMSAEGRRNLKEGEQV